MRIAAARVHPYTLPFTSPVLTGRGEFRQRPGYLLELTDDQGRRGWGDAAPWTGFESSPLELVHRCLTEVSEGTVIGDEFESVAHVRDWVSRGAYPNEVTYATELALLDLLGQSLGVPVASLLGPPATNDTKFEAVPLCAVASTPQDAAERVAQGYGTLKIKVGTQPWLEEQQRVLNIRRAVGDDVRLRLDANEAWRDSNALDILADLEPLNIEWLEQPAPNWIDWVGHGTPIAVDESVGRALGRAETPKELAAMLSGADVWVLKPMYVGGLLAAAALAAEARTRVVAVSSSWESAVGRLGSLHLAAALGHGPAAGLASPLSRDVAAFPPLVDGAARLPDVAGLGSGEVSP